VQRIVVAELDGAVDSSRVYVSSSSDIAALGESCLEVEFPLSSLELAGSGVK